MEARAARDAMIAARYLPAMFRRMLTPLWRVARLLPLLAAPAAFAQQYDVRTYGLEQGLPSASVRALCEDAAGFLWIATDGGAVRTDGIHFTTYGLREGLPTEGVTALHARADGAMWLGLPNGTLAVVDRLGLHMEDLGLLPEAPLVAFATDGAGTLHAASSGGHVIAFAAEGLRVMDQRHGLPAGPLRAFVATVEGGLLAGTDDGIYQLHEGRWLRTSVSDRLPDPMVFALHADSLGVVVGTANGYLELDRELLPLPAADRFTGTFPIALPDARVLAIQRSREGDLWLGTPAGLVQLTRRGGQPKLRSIAEVNGLGHDLVRCVHQDRSGTVWAGTAFGGVSKVVSAAFLHFTDRDGLGSRIVSAIHRTPDGLLWLATMGGGVACWDGDRLRVFGRAEGLHDLYALCFAEDAQGRLLVGTGTEGLFRWELDRFVPLGMPAPGAGRILSLATDGSGTLWAGTLKGLYQQSPGQPWRQANGAMLPPVNDLLATPGAMWAATDNGLYVLPDGAAAPMPHALPGIKATSLVRDSHGSLWVGTDGRGLMRVAGDSVQVIGLGQGMPSLAVELLLLDPYENLWVGTRQGFAYVELDELQDRILRITVHGMPDGFIGTEAFRNACMLDGDSTLWFGTVRGATRHDPRQRLVESREPSVRLIDLQLFFEHPDWSPWSEGIGPDGLPTGLVLPHDRNHLTFGYTGISLAFPEQVRYRYILEGHDPDWSPITATDRVTYSNLPPGDYVFRVEARNTLGWTPEPVAYAFRIEPPFWHTTPFRLGAGLFILLGLGGSMRLRERQLRRDRERLERTVVQRTRELATERDRSERLLRNILPASTAEELKTHGTAEARRYENVSVLFSDFSGFTGYSSLMDSRELVAELDHFFRLFDRLSDEHGVEKIKTIGDAYMCASGIPEPCDDHALRMVRMALGMQAAAAEVNAARRSKGLAEWPLRIGIHSGPLVAGVVGEKKFAYDIWGDTVNLASRMESNGEPGRVNISGATYALVMDAFNASPRGPIRVKGKGELWMYFIEGPRMVAQG